MDPGFTAAFANDARFQAGVSLSASTENNKSPMDLAREQARGLVDASKVYHAAKLPPASAYQVREKTIAVEGGTLRLRCLTPTDIEEDASLPVLVWFHSGGWIVGDLEQDDNHLRSICVELQLCVVNVDYRLAPEHPFPTSVNDAYNAMKWVTENAQSLRISLSKGFIVGGDSAGANMATVCAHLAHDDPLFEGRQPTGQLLREPSVVQEEVYPAEYKAELLSMEEFKDGPLLTREALKQCRALLQAAPADPRISPLLFPSHAGVPRAFITYNGADPLRDDGRLFARMLREAGVPTLEIMYPGVPHGFYYSFPDIALGRKSDQDIRDGLRWLLADGMSE
ncbi:uncharacterized protein TRAVEDRAFT_53604 [Trametes versicolor FP-101664 SS1]|uniref:uncharacterized protein n=1 Tax=Trametes versicolor (strain FP-101664) TaxID=717944 RepID=UPI0004623935|nr:uncharacterized protein TRAVEDRAFT_53604 [Trametes versicolor FP-101664 SS1]EIW52179.1 hypothetical protein TRAVEDRAFT_53604 [Trametes versicolor FP-101664 SS1]